MRVLTDSLFCARAKVSPGHFTPSMFSPGRVKFSTTIILSRFCQVVKHYFFYSPHFATLKW